MGDMHMGHQPFLDDQSLFQPNLLDLNPQLDMQYSSRLVDYSNYADALSLPPTISPMDAYNNPNYIPEDSQLLGNSVPVRSDSATSDDTTRGQMSHLSATTSQTSFTPPQREPGYMNPTAMVDQVLEGTLSSSSNTKPYAAPMPGAPKNKMIDGSISARPGEISDGIFLVNPTGKIVHCNTTVSALLGWSKDKLVGADIRTTLHPEDVNK